MTSQEQQRLTEAERRIAEFRQRIAEQEDLIATLREDGHPTRAAEELLMQFKESLRLGEEHRQVMRLCALRRG